MNEPSPRRTGTAGVFSESVLECGRKIGAGDSSGVQCQSIHRAHAFCEWGRGGAPAPSLIRTLHATQLLEAGVTYTSSLSPPNQTESEGDFYLWGFMGLERKRVECSNENYGNVSFWYASSLTLITRGHR